MPGKKANVKWIECRRIRFITFFKVYNRIAADAHWRNITDIFFKAVEARPGLSEDVTMHKLPARLLCCLLSA